MAETKKSYESTVMRMAGNISMSVEIARAIVPKIEIEQDVDRWERELREAGWRQWLGLPGTRQYGRPHRTIWEAPSGALFRGPAGAWRRMKEGAR